MFYWVNWLDSSRFRVRLEEGHVAVYGIHSVYQWGYWWLFFMVSLYQDACDFFFWFSWDSCQCYRISRVCNILLGDMSDFRFARESQDSLISLGMLAISRDVSIIYIRGIWNLILQISSMSKNELMKLLMEFSQDSLEFINFFLKILRHWNLESFVYYFIHAFLPPLGINLIGNSSNSCSGYPLHQIW